jgi:hypothetical protein
VRKGSRLRGKPNRLLDDNAQALIGAVAGRKPRKSAAKGAAPTTNTTNPEKTATTSKASGLGWAVRLPNDETFARGPIADLPRLGAPNVVVMCARGVEVQATLGKAKQRVAMKELADKAYRREKKIPDDPNYLPPVFVVVTDFKGWLALTLWSRQSHFHALGETHPPTVISDDDTSTYIYALTTNPASYQSIHNKQSWSIENSNDIDGVLGFQGDAFLLMEHTPCMLSASDRIAAILVSRYSREDDTIWDMTPHKYDASGLSDNLCATALALQRQYVAFAPVTDDADTFQRSLDACKQAACILANDCWGHPWRATVPYLDAAHGAVKIYNRADVCLALAAAAVRGANEEPHDVEWWMAHHHASTTISPTHFATLEIKASRIASDAGMGLFTTVDIDMSDKSLVCAFSGRWIAASKASNLDPVKQYIYALTDKWPKRFRDLVKYWVYDKCQANYINSATTKGPNGETLV